MSNGSRFLLIVALLVAEACLAWLPAAPPPPAPARPTASPVGLHSPAAGPSTVPTQRLTPDEVAQRRLARLSRETEQLRHRTFLRPVPTSEKSREEVRRYLERELDKDTDWKAEEARLEEFGFIAPGYGLRKHLLDFYESQVLGYYDTDTGSYHMVSAAPKGIGSRALDLGWDLVQPGARIEQEEIAMVHELDHALTDQHFDLKKAQTRARATRNTDVATAVQCLIEGDATMIMFHCQDRRMGIDPAYTRLDPSTIEIMQWVQGFFGGAEFNSFPLYFQRAALFPYLYGGVFVDQHRFDRGWPAVDRMYSRLPASTEQILHAEKYLGAVDPPVMITFQGPLAAAPVGMRAVATDSMGEFQIRLMFENLGFSPSDAAAWAAGWGGDSFRIFERPGRPRERHMVWVSTWDDEAAALRFFKGLQRLATKRYVRPGQPSPRTKAGQAWDLSLPGGRVVDIARRGRWVVYLQNVPDALMSRCRTMARQATAAPFRVPGFAVRSEP